jgi:hypothetical protein
MDMTRQDSWPGDTGNDQIASSFVSADQESNSVDWHRLQSSSSRALISIINIPSFWNETPAVFFF